MRRLLVIASCFLFSRVHAQEADNMPASKIYVKEAVMNTLPSYSGFIKVFVEALPAADTINRFNKGKLYNNTSDTLFFLIRNVGKLIAIQEARDKNGNWQPVEYFFNDRCGNSFDEFALAPHYVLNFELPRYTGTFKTKMRLCIRLDNGLFAFSNEWPAYINERQFEKPKEALDKDIKIFYDFLYR